MSELSAQSEDYLAIRRLQDAYADVVSRRAFGELHDLFLPTTSVLVELPGRTREITGPDDQLVLQRRTEITALPEVIDRYLADGFEFVTLSGLIDRSLEAPNGQV